MFDHQKEDAESAEATHCKRFIGSTGIREEDARLANKQHYNSKILWQTFWSSLEFQTIHVALKNIFLLRA